MFPSAWEIKLEQWAHVINRWRDSVWSYQCVWLKIFSFHETEGKAVTMKCIALIIWTQSIGESWLHPLKTCWFVLQFLRIAYTHFLKLGPCFIKTRLTKTKTTDTKWLPSLAKGSTTSTTIWTLKILLHQNFTYKHQINWSFTTSCTQLC